MTEAPKTIPDWLTPALPQEPSSSDTPSSDPHIAQIVKPEAWASLRREMREETFGRIFEQIIDKIIEGYTLNDAIAEDHREIDPGKFMRWVRKDPTRMRAYVEAKEIRTEAWAGKMIKHMTASETAEDVSRSTLIVNGYKWLMAADNRKTYGDSKQIEVNQNISITAALEQAQGRLIQHQAALDALEHED